MHRWILLALFAFPAQSFAQQWRGGNLVPPSAGRGGGHVGHTGYTGYRPYAGYGYGYGYGGGFYYPRTNYNSFQIQSAPSTTVYRGNPDPPFVPYFTLLEAARPAPMPPTYAPPVAAAPVRAPGPEYISIRLHHEPKRRRR